MAKTIGALALFVVVYLCAATFLVVGIPSVIAWLHANLSSFVAAVASFPLKLIHLGALLLGWVASFYIWWHTKPVVLVQKIIIWINRIAVVALVLISVPQLFFFFADPPDSQVAAQALRENWIRDLGLLGAAMYLAYACLSALVAPSIPYASREANAT